jgi:hypothetical protein
LSSCHVHGVGSPPGAKCSHASFVSLPENDSRPRSPSVPPKGIRHSLPVNHGILQLSSGTRMRDSRSYRQDTRRPGTSSVVDEHQDVGRYGCAVGRDRLQVASPIVGLSQRLAVVPVPVRPIATPNAPAMAASVKSSIGAVMLAAIADQNPQRRPRPSAPAPLRGQAQQGRGTGEPAHNSPRRRVAPQPSRNPDSGRPGGQTSNPSVFTAR